MKSHIFEPFFNIYINVIFFITKGLYLILNIVWNITSGEHFKFWGMTKKQFTENIINKLDFQTYLYSWKLRKELKPCIFNTNEFIH